MFVFVFFLIAISASIFGQFWEAQDFKNRRKTICFSTMCVNFYKMEVFKTDPKHVSLWVHFHENFKFAEKRRRDKASRLALEFREECKLASE